MFEAEKSLASSWFKTLRDEIVSAFKQIEIDHLSGPFSDEAPGIFEVKETERTADDGSDAGGGIMSVMRNGRVFEKVGVNVSTVYGKLGLMLKERWLQKRYTGIKEDPRFWASGISLVAHMQNPQCPAVHMNTRMFWTPTPGGLVVDLI